MLSGRRTSVLAIALAVAVSIAAGYFGVRALLHGGFTWGGGADWSEMEALVGSQQLGAVTLAIEFDPESKWIEGEAEVTFARPGGDGGHVVLLLNRGLDVGRVTCDGARVSAQRRAERLIIELPAGTTSGTLAIPYRGRIDAVNRAPMVWTDEEIILDRLQFWYPVDLTSFSTLAVTATVPEDFEVVWSGALEGNGQEGGRRTVRWTESRPVLAAGFAAGRYTRVSRVQGSVRCNVYGKAIEERATGPWLTHLGDASNYFHAQLGADGFQQLNLVVSEGVSAPVHLGGSLLLSPPGPLARGGEDFVTLARLVAGNWWGETVSGRWFSTRPEAGEWLLSGLSEYSAWQALRSIKGRRDYLRYRESLYCPPELPGPLKAFNLEQRLLPGGGDERLFNVRGPYVAAMLAQYVGDDAFNRACRNFMSVHRHTTVSYAALLHEMVLASERPLDELVRVWFDRPGVLDYGVTNVTVESDRVLVSIENVGDIPAYVPIELGLVSEDGYQVQRVEPGARGDTLSVPFSGTLKRVVLDPEFALADMRRANNVWPRTEWPTQIAVASSGRTALVVQPEWGEPRSHLLQFFSPAGRTPESAYRIAGDGVPVITWDPTGQSLSVQGGHFAGLLREGGWTPLGEDSAVFAGWVEGGACYWSGGRIWAQGEAAEVSSGELPRPVPGLVALQRGSGRLACVSESGRLLVREAGDAEPRLLREGVKPVGGLRWRGESAALIYVDESGKIESVPVDGGEPTTLLQRNYAITQARLSEGGGRVAWVDPAGLLRAVTPGAGEPVYISLPGEVIDFAWEGEDALVAIAANIPRRLPMRFHADYSLWRIPASTWQGVQLPYDPAASAGAGLAPVEIPASRP